MLYKTMQIASDLMKTFVMATGNYCTIVISEENHDWTQSFPMIIKWKPKNNTLSKQFQNKLVLLWAHPIYPPLTSVQPISITKTLLIVPTKNERDPPLFTNRLLIKFQNILRNTTKVIIRHRVKILFSVISSPITLERQKWKSSKKKGILLSSPVNRF